MLLSSIVAFELWYGVATSQRPEANTLRLDAFLAGPLEWTLFDTEDAHEIGVVRAELRWRERQSARTTSCSRARRDAVPQRW